MKVCCGLLVCLLSLFILGGCEQVDENLSTEANFEEWYPQYNRYIRDWLAKKVEIIGTESEILNHELAETSDEAGKKKIQDALLEKKKLLERMQNRQSMGDYFQFKTIEDLPPALVWNNGLEQPEIGDPAAKKGGAFRYFVSSFPPTIRPFGPNSNNSFRGELYDNIEISLVDLHPETGEVIPGVAKEWAIGADGKTVFFRLDPEAKYNDGVPIKAIDFMWWVYIRASDNVVTPWFKQYLREQLAQFTLYGEDLIAISLPEPKPKLAYFATIPPSPPH